MSLADRYEVHVSAARDDSPSLTVRCKKCDVTVFGWKSTRAFALDTMAGPIAAHEDVWHTDKQA